MRIDENRLSLWRRALPIAALALLALVVIASGALDALRPSRLPETAQALREFARVQPFVAAAAIFGGIATLVASGLPGGSALVATGGLLFGTVAGTALALAGNGVGGLVLFLASRRLFEGGRRAPPAVALRLRDGFARAPWSYVMLLRLAPVVPYGAASAALAWLRCPVRVFVLASLVGSALPTAMYASLGAALGDAMALRTLSPRLFLEPRFALPLAALAVLAALPLVARLRGTSGPRAPASADRDGAAK